MSGDESCDDHHFEIVHDFNDYYRKHIHVYQLLSFLYNQPIKIKLEIDQFESCCGLFRKVSRR